MMENATVSAARCVSRGHTTIPDFSVTYPSWVARYPSRSRMMGDVDGDGDGDGDDYDDRCFVHKFVNKTSIIT